MKAPESRPCGSCPYRKDVPGGVWDEEEYAKLPLFDATDPNRQPVAVFGCHQNNGHLCAGWVGCHDMYESLALRINYITGFMTLDDYEKTLAYECPVPLWESGAEAAEHGMSAIDKPGDRAQTIMRNLRRKGVGDGPDPRELRKSDDQRSPDTDASAE